jgi:hypothetical protein
MTTTRNNENKQLQFEGIFKGREKEIRVTPDKQVSVFDFIKVVGGQKNPKKTWYDVQNNRKNELGTFCSQFKFPGQGKTLTPVINVRGMVKLLFWLPGELAKQFRSKSAEVMIRYLGGDMTLINEIKAIDQEHTVNPDNIAQVFRHHVSEANDLLLKQIGQSDYMIKHFHAKSILYLGHVEQNEESQIVKYGHTSDIKSTHRRHQQSYGNEFKFLHVVECKEHYKLESMIKSHNDLQTRHVKMYNEQPRQELIRLDTHFDLNKFIELISDMQSSLKHANQNDHDLTSKIKILELESQVKLQEETTKQMQIEAKIQEEKTKQMEIELRMTELKMLQAKTQDLKLEPAPNTQQTQPASNIQQTVNDQTKEEQNRKIENLVKKFMETRTEHSVRSQDHIYISDLHHHFEVWYDSNKPNDIQQCIPKKVFNEYLVLIGYPTRIRRTIDVIGKNGRKLKKTTLPNRKLTLFPQT